jgi:Ca2+-binding RTX toxin-like protein
MTRYLFGRGSGQDFIYDYDATSGNLDTILLDSDVTPDDVALSRNNNDLTLTIEDTGDSITVSNWFESDEYQIERIGFADGTVWNVPIISEMLYKGTAGNDVLIGSYAADTFRVGRR